MVNALLGPEGYEILTVDKSNWDQLRAALLKIEEIFPNTLRDTEESLAAIMGYDRSIFLAVKVSDSVVGYIAGASLESFGQIPGVRQDPHFGVKDTIYLHSHGVIEKFQKQGIGKYLMRCFTLRAKALNFVYMSAHVRKGFATKWRGTSLREFPNWFGTGKTFEYYRRDLELGNWHEGCSNMITVQTILAGFSAIVLTLTLTTSLTSGNVLPIIPVVFSTVLFFYAAEKATDALDHRDPTPYVDALIPYNFAVVFLLVGLSMTILEYSQVFQLLKEGSWLQMLGLGLALAIPIVASFHWMIDAFWLLKKRNRMVYLATMEFGEEEPW